MCKSTTQIGRQFAGCVIIRHQSFHFLTVFCQKRLVSHQMTDIIFKVKEDVACAQPFESVESLQTAALCLVELVSLIDAFHQRDHLVNFRTVDGGKTAVRERKGAVEIIERFARTLIVDAARKVFPHIPIGHSVCHNLTG